MARVRSDRFAAREIRTDATAVARRSYLGPNFGFPELFFRIISEALTGSCWLGKDGTSDPRTRLDASLPPRHWLGGCESATLRASRCGDVESPSQDPSATTSSLGFSDSLGSGSPSRELSERPGCAL